MEAQRQVRRAAPDEARWIVDLSARVQAALTASGSLQQIGPLPLESVQTSVQAGNAYLLEVAGKPVGSVMVDPLPDDSPHNEIWKLDALPRPLWFLHKLMLDPEEQGKGLGLDFLNGVKQLLTPASGSIVLDCWAGNDNLRAFYQRAGFTLHGVFLFPFEDYEVAVFFIPI